MDISENWSDIAPPAVDAFFLQACDSTNERARALIEQSHISRDTWIVAGEQSAGRGRRGRAWVSAEGNFFGSLIWRPQCAAEKLAFLPYMVGLGLRQGLVDLGVSPSVLKCKWPNDILLNGKKIAGILIEANSSKSGAADHVVIGVGVNLRHFPADAQFKASSVFDETGSEISLKNFFSSFSLALEKNLSMLGTANPASLIKEWEGVSWGLGEVRTIRTIDATFEAKLVAVAGDGGLRVEMPDGGEDIIYAGDIFGAGLDGKG